MGERPQVTEQSKENLRGAWQFWPVVIIRLKVKIEFYSYLSAIIGSTLVARWAGIPSGLPICQLIS